MPYFGRITVQANSLQNVTTLEFGEQYGPYEAQDIFDQIPLDVLVIKP